MHDLFQHSLIYEINQLFCLWTVIHIMLLDNMTEKSSIYVLICGEASLCLKLYDVLCVVQQSACTGITLGYVIIYIMHAADDKCVHGIIQPGHVSVHWLWVWLYT